MADPFYEPLPGLGDVPWSLNGAVQEIRERISDVDDFISSEGIEQAIATAAGTLTPEALSDAFIAARIGEEGSATETELSSGFEKRAGVAVDARYYGVTADGTTDDTVALQAALNSVGALGAGVLKLPVGTIRTSAITIPAGVTVVGAGKRLTRLKQVGTPGYLVTVQGSITPNLATVNADVDKWATGITLNSTAGLSAGDFIALHDAFSYTTTDASYKSGEMLRVTSILNSTQIEVDTRVRGSWANASGTYTVANTTRISKITPVTGVTLADLTLEGDVTSTTGLFLAQFAHNLTLQNIDVLNSGSMGLRIAHCHTVSITNYTARNLIDDLPGGHVGYAISVSGVTENLTVLGGMVVGARHGFTTMGSDYGMPHNLTVSGMFVSQCNVSGLDTHAAGEDILFTGNTVSSCAGGIAIRSRGTTISGNRISKVYGHGISANENNLKDISILSNHIEDVTNENHGISAGGLAITLTISGNTLNRVAADGIRINSASRNVTVNNNIVRDVGVSLTGRSHIRPADPVGSTSATSGWFMSYNTCIQTASANDAARAVDGLSGGLTGAYIAWNTCAGTFTSAPFNNPQSQSLMNRQLGTTPPEITGSRSGNSALAGLLSRLATEGYITDSTTA
jgi:parallel beta-helix repeat protein